MNYYISATGNDSLNGTSEATAWQTIGKVNSTTFAPGDFIWFKDGDSFTGNLVIQNSGTSAAPIIVSSSGRATINCGTGDAVRVKDCEYVWTSGLKAMGADSGRNSNATPAASNGCGFTALSTQTSGAKWRGIKFTNLISDGCRTGVLMQCNDGSAVGTKQTGFRGYDDWQITYCEVTRAALCGIFTWCRPGAAKATLDFQGVYPEVGYERDIFSNFLIERNNVHDNYGYNTTTWAQVGWGTGIRTMNCSGTSTTRALVQYNRVDNGGYAGSATGMPANFEAEVCNWITWQYNESSRCRMTGGADGAGFDVFDGGVEDCLLQYNYAWNNDGYGIGGGGAGGLATTRNHARFNILVNNNLFGNEADFKVWGDMGSIYFYNNIVFSNKNAGHLVKMTANVGGYVANNIFVSLGTKALVSMGATRPKLLNNLYWRGTADNLGITLNGTTYNTLATLRAAGEETLNSTNYGLNANPLLQNAGATNTFLPNALVKIMTDYDLLAGSPAIGAGVDFSALYGSVGPKDFHDKTFTGLNIGAVQQAVGPLGSVSTNKPTIGIAKQTVAFAAAGITSANTAIIYELSEEGTKTYVPGGGSNTLTTFTVNKSYYVIAKDAVDLTATLLISE